MKSRPDKNSTTAAVAGFQGPMGSIPLPEGVVLRSDEERVIWAQFTRARTRADWRDMDLLLLAKVVRLEADIRKHQTTRAGGESSRHDNPQPAAVSGGYFGAAADGDNPLYVAEPDCHRPAHTQRRGPDRGQVL